MTDTQHRALMHPRAQGFSDFGCQVWRGAANKNADRKHEGTGIRKDVYLNVNTDRQGIAKQSADIVR
jgi:hypothetical protein